MSTTAVRIVVHGGEGFAPLEVHVSNGTPQSRDWWDTSEPRVFDFEVPAGESFTVAITVTPPEWVTQSWFEAFVRAYPVLVQQLDPTPSERGKPGTYVPAEPKHPRLVSVVSATHPSSKRIVVKLVVDLSFLNVTKWLSRDPYKRALRQLHPETPARDRDPRGDPQYRPDQGRCEFYELTAGPRTPRLWTVCYNTARPPHHVLLFLMPKGEAYAGIGDLSGEWAYPLRRYLLSPADNEPFFLRIYEAHPPERPAPITEWYTMVTHCGFFDQLVRSGKTVALVLPLGRRTSDGCDYGVLDAVATARRGGPDGSPCESDLRALVQSLRRALAADDILAPAKLAPPFRTAVAGFSAGAPKAYLLLARNEAAVDEFYWFDPARSLINNTDYRRLLAHWINGNSTRRLRLIGGMNQEALLVLEGNLRPGAGSRVSAIPVADFYQNSLVYKCAVSVPPGYPPSAQEQFTPAGTAAPPGSLSERRNIFLGTARPTDQGVRLVAYDPPGNVVVQTQAPNAVAPCTMADAIGLARYHWFQGAGPQPHKLYQSNHLPSIADFARLVREKVEEPDGYRHQWAVVGGDGDTYGGDPTRVGSFVGHLQYCIDKGNFP